GRRVFQVDAPAFERRNQVIGKRVGIDLEADGERRAGAHARADATETLAGDGFVQLEGAAPEVLVAEGIEAEDLAAALQHVARVLVDDRVEAGGRLPLSRI